MTQAIETLGTELEKIDGEYAAEFAGQSRLTREVANLDRIIERTKVLLSRVDQVPVAAQGPDMTRLRDAASQNLALYEQERAAIERAQAAGPVFEQFSEEATSANLTFAKYGRHFAGQDRSTRDLGLLGELVDDLKGIDKRMTELIKERKSTEFDRDRQVVRDNLAQYQKEIGLVEKAQTTGTDEEQASVLASVANGQFALYQTHFAGHSRVSRRPSLLMRLVGTLKKSQARMRKLKEDGLKIEFNDKNIDIVSERLAVYETELTEIRKVRQQTSMVDIMGELGGAANTLFDEYRKNFADKPRKDVDLELLASICDRLGEIRRQMIELGWAETNDVNDKNREVVTEQLIMFENEYEAVLRVRSPKT